MQIITVTQLIKALEKCNPDSKVYFSIDSTCDVGGITAVQYDTCTNIPKGAVYLLNNNDFIYENGVLSTNIFLKT